MRPATLLILILRILPIPSKRKKNGSRMRVEKINLYAAIASGGLSLILMSMEAVETAMMLMISANLGGNPGLSSMLRVMVNFLYNM